LKFNFKDVLDISFSSDNNRFSLETTNKIIVCSLQPFQVIKRITKKEGGIYHLSPQCKHILFHLNGNVFYESLDRLYPIAIAKSCDLTGFAFSPNERYLAVEKKDKFYLYDLKKFGDNTDGVKSFTSEDFLEEEKDAQDDFFPFEDNKKDNKEKTAKKNYIEFFKFSKNGKYLAAVSKNGKIKVIDTASQKCIFETFGAFPFNSLNLDSEEEENTDKNFDKFTLFGLGEDDIALLRKHDMEILNVQFSELYKTIAILGKRGKDTIIRMYNIETGKIICEENMGQLQNVSGSTILDLG